MDNSWIKLYRAIKDSKVWNDEKMLKVWLHVLIEANYKKQYVTVTKGTGKHTVEIGRGQLLWGRKAAAKELNLSESTAERCLKKLELWGNITRKVNNQFTVVTVCKYDSYQAENSEGERELNVNCTRTEREVNTYKKAKKDNKAKNSLAEPQNYEKPGTSKDRINEAIPQSFEEVERYFVYNIQNTRLAQEYAGRFWQEMVDKNWKLSNGSEVLNWKRIAHVSYISEAQGKSEKLKEQKYNQNRQEHGSKMIPVQQGPPKMDISHFMKDYRNN